MWMDEIKRSKEEYRMALITSTTAAPPSHDYLYHAYDNDDNDSDYPSSALMSQRSPRGSARGSSLHHSHR